MPRQVFADPLTLDFSSITGMPPTETPLDQYTGILRGAFVPFVVTHHAITGHVVDINGDRATVHARVRAERWLPDESADGGPIRWLVVGFYGNEAVRTADGRRLDREKLTSTCQENAHLARAALPSGQVHRRRGPRPTPRHRESVGEGERPDAAYPGSRHRGRPRPRQEHPGPGPGPGPDRAGLSARGRARGVDRGAVRGPGRGADGGDHRTILEASTDQAMQPMFRAGSGLLVTELPEGPGNPFHAIVVEVENVVRDGIARRIPCCGRRTAQGGTSLRCHALRRRSSSRR
ncbi:nuclear transport factor 2 family protein [Streptomyces sp. NPDC050549]|uniref:nuclear transport factor 2 family protein n=1 Tax=Streptomyces sp. NPDC050549 TaxID=3155406 RepID=UPI00342E34B1